MSADYSEVDKLADDLAAVPEKLRQPLEKVVERGAFNIKRDMQSDAQSSGSYRHFSRSISYDRDGLRAEIGPDKDRIQGALGNILYFGTSKNAPVLDLNAPLNKEKPKFAENVATVAGDPL